MDREQLRDFVNDKNHSKNAQSLTGHSSKRNSGDGVHRAVNRLERWVDGAEANTDWIKKDCTDVGVTIVKFP